MMDGMCKLCDKVCRAMSLDSLGKCKVLDIGVELEFFPLVILQPPFCLTS